MNLLEYQARELLRSAGLAVPTGELARSAEDAARIAAGIGGPVVVKAQVRRGGRGKAGGVRLAPSPEDAASRAAEILGARIGGEPVDSVLVVQAANIAREIYLALAVDRSTRSLTIIASAAGGVDIEETARRDPAAVLRLAIDPLYGLADYQCREVARLVGLAGQPARALADVLGRMHRLMAERDATLVEINPLALTVDDRLICLDAKIVLDDNASARQSWLSELEPPIVPAAEQSARSAGLSYVELDGSIGCVVNGAGLAMATMDVVGLYGGRPANFLDIGGGARAERVAAALRILLADGRVRAVLFNIFGGITRCDEVARGIVAALDDVPTATPIVVRLAGTAAAEAQGILAAAGVNVRASMDEAARLAVSLAGSAGQSRVEVTE